MGRTDAARGVAAAVHLPMRHPIRPEQRGNVLEACQDFWEDHEDSFVKMIFERTPQFALSLCSEQLDACRTGKQTGRLPEQNALMLQPHDRASETKPLTSDDLPRTGT